jgi:uncharacterized protein YfaS (alpha-2-macroglobulin family)
MSRVLPNAMVAQTFHKLGIRNELLEADLPPMMDLGLQKLYGFQHNDGGWGWWYDDSTDVNQTAYVLFGLAMTKQAGFDVDGDVIERGAEALRQMLPSADPRIQAYGVYVLVMAGQPVSITLTVSDALELDLFSQAVLAIAFDVTGHETVTNVLLDNLREAVIQDDTTAHWADEADHVVYSRKVMGSTVRTTAMVTDALARLDPESPLLPKAVRWLMEQRQGQGWGDTQKTSYAVWALSDYLFVSQKLASGVAFQVYVNGELWREGRLDRAEVGQTLVLTYDMGLAAGEVITTSEGLTDGKVITPSETITTSEAPTTGEVITPSETITTSEALTSSEALTTTESLTDGKVITSSETITASETITTSEPLTSGEALTTGEIITPSEAITSGKTSSPSLLQPGENRVTIVLGAAGQEPSGRLYYGMSLVANRAPREGIVPALQTHARSITVRRSYQLQGDKTSATRFQRGALVQVHLTLDVPEESWYVVVDDPLPGGFEALNERLGTTSYAAAAYQEPVYYWQQYGYNRKDVRDDRVSFFITRLAPGQRTFTYLMRATTAGDFAVLPTQVYPMYEPDVWSRSESTEVKVR